MLFNRALYSLEIDKKALEAIENMPPDAYCLQVNGSIVHDLKDLKPGSLFQIHFRLCGGKGGFGAMLKKFRNRSSDNKLMCRDLSGRRLADVKEEERLRNWIANTEIREKAKLERRQAKLNKLKKLDRPKHKFTDQEYLRRRDKVIDDVEDAIEAGLAALKEKTSSNALDLVEIDSKNACSDGRSEMSSKARGAVKKIKKGLSSIVHSPYCKIKIRAQMATAAPPLGPVVGQRNINVQQFCKEFNERTSNFVPGTPLNVRFMANPDRTYEMDICAPPSTWLLLRAAGIKRGAEMTKYNREICGKLSVKHIFEIAKLKQQDKALRGTSLPDICKKLIATCYKMGIQVTKQDLDPIEYGKFLDGRRHYVQERLNYLAAERAKKLLEAEQDVSTTKK